MNMRLIGCRTVDELDPEFIDTGGLSTRCMHTTGVPSDTLGSNVYGPLAGPKEKVNMGSKL